MLDVILEHKRISKEEAKKLIADILRTVALPPEVDRMFPHELSGGMKQRVLIGADMTLNPPAYSSR